MAAALVIAATGCVPTYRATPSSWTLRLGTVTGPEVRLRAGLAASVGVLWENDADQNRDFDAIAASGAVWTTLDFDWNSIQGDGPLSFRWDRATDRVVLNARRHGLAIVGVAAYSPPWARGPECPPGESHCFPANPDDYGRFLGAAAARYGSQSSNALLRGSVTTWQLWNEPNHQAFSQPRPNLDRYAAMVKSAYRAIKAADPNATVITGGMAPAPDAPDGTDYRPETWLRGLYDRGVGGFFDAVGHHPYAFPFNPLEPRSWNTFTNTLSLYGIMDEHGDGRKRIWGTEVSAPTGTDAGVLSEADQARWVRDYYLGWNTVLRDITGPLIWQPVRNTGTNPADKWQNTGLLRNDWRPKPAYTAYQLVMAAGV